VEPRTDASTTDPDGLRWSASSAGRGAAYLDADAPPSAELARRLAQRRQVLWSSRPRSLYDLLPAYGGLLAEFRAGADAAEVLQWLTAPAPDAEAGAGDGTPRLPEPRHHEVAVRYGDRADREALERATGLPWQALVDAHAGARYTVAFIGFTPGFPYLYGLPEVLALPRRERPEARLPAGAVAVADGQAGIYPSAGPGGWWVVGTTDTSLFDPGRAPPALLAAGDTLRFVPLPAGGPPRGRSPAGVDAPLDADDAVLHIDEVWSGAATLQALPRWGVGHHGMAQSGALAPRAHGGGP